MNQEPSKGFNLSKWALDHSALTRYLMIVLMLLGAAAYFQLGQDEDPPFTSEPWSCAPTGPVPPPSKWRSR